MQARPAAAWSEAERAYRWLLVLSSAVFLGLFVFLALRRLPYPYELEWMEGGMVDEVRHILLGKPVYVQPTIDYIPYVYTPGYFYVCALFTKLLGVGFVPLRLVSLLSTLGCFGVLYLIVRRETGDAVLGFAAAGLAAATFHISGSWFDIARSDSLFLLLFLLAVYWLRFHPTVRGAVVSGVFFAAAFFAKQTALFAAVPLVLWTLAVDWRRGVALALVLGSLVGGISLAWNALSGGWYYYYVFELPRHHPIVKDLWWKFWTVDLLRRFPVPLFVALPLFFLRSSGGARGFYAGLAVGLIGASWLIRVRTGSFDNILIPAYTALALLAPLGLQALSVDPRRPSWLSSLAAAALAVQFALLWYPPAKEMPSQADREAGDALMERLGKIGGDIWIPGHAFLATRIGAPPHAQTVAIGDVLTGGGYLKQQLSNEIQQALHNQQFSAVAMDYTDALYNSELRGRYERAAGELFKDRNAFYPVTGNRTRPKTLYVPQTGESRPGQLPEPAPYSHR
jgi:hypothetical protein